MTPASGIGSAVPDVEGADRIRTGVSPLTGDSSDEPSDYEPTPSRKTRARSEELSLEGLREFTLDSDPQIAAAAATALRCVEAADADPRLMLLVIEAAVEGQ